MAPVARGNTHRRPFRFEAAWLSHPRFKELLAISWNRTIDTREALKRLKRILRKWNREVFGDVQVRKEKLLEKLKEVQEMVGQHPTDVILWEEGELLEELDVVLEQEEIIWFQKSREKWVVQGDRNTKFFHTTTIIRRRRNRIEKLKDGEWRWITTTQELEKLVVDYFRRLYSLDDVDPNVDKLPSRGLTQLSQEDR